jgi:murein DD-endopeptidase MepM/ murein hydrolase activator NlpD
MKIDAPPFRPTSKSPRLKTWLITIVMAALGLFTVTLVTAAAPQSGGMGVSTTGWVTTLFVEPISYQTSGNYYDQNNQLSSVSYTFHHGVDISGGCTAGSYPVYAAAAGTVAFAQYIGDGYGTQVAIDHGYNLGGNGRYTYTFYSHMGNRTTGARYILVSPGQHVEAGDIVGYQGNDGSAFGSCQPNPGTHLDWEVRVSSSAVAYGTQMRYSTTAASQDFYTFKQLTYDDLNPLSQVSAGPFNGGGATNTPTATPTNTPVPPQPTWTPGPCGMQFSDVSDTFWAYPYISYVYCHGIIGGYEDGTFRPANALTRGQFAKMVVIGHGWNLYNPYYPSFSDVPTTDTFYQYIETAHLRDVVSGYTDGTYKPGNSVTRAQATKMLVIAHGWALLNPTTPSFPDVPRSHWSYQYVETGYSRGIVGPKPNGTFGPDEEIVRAELCKLLALTLQQGLRPGDPGQPAYR